MGTPHFYFQIEVSTVKTINRQSLTKISVQVLSQRNDLKFSADINMKTIPCPYTTKCLPMYCWPWPTSSTMLSMEKAMRRLASASEDHATPPKRRRKSPATSAMSDSRDSDPEKSDSEELNLPPDSDPPNWAALSQRMRCSMKLLKTLSWMSKLT